jgi:hypothetical protein
MAGILPPRRLPLQIQRNPPRPDALASKSLGNCILSFPPCSFYCKTGAGFAGRVLEESADGFDCFETSGGCRNNPVNTEETGDDPDCNYFSILFNQAALALSA